MIRIVAQASPFHPPVLCETDSGRSIEELLGNRYPDVAVTLNGIPVPVERWDCIPADGALLTATRVPEGPVKVIAIAVAQAMAAAASAAAAAIGSAVGALAGAMGATATIGGVSLGVTWGTVASVALSVVSAVVGMVIQPQMPSVKSPGAAGGRYFSLTGGQNRAAKFEAIPKLYGTFQITPPLAAGYYTQVQDNKQYLHILLCLGYGPLQIDGHIVGVGHDMITRADNLSAGTIKIGETDIYEFDNCRFEIGSAAQVCRSQGLYSNDIEQQSFQVDMNHSHPEGTGEGGWFTGPDGYDAMVTRTTPVNTKTISLDVEFPAMVTVGKDGQEEELIVEWRIRYSLTGANDWHTVIDPWETRGKTKSPRRFSYEFDVPDVGQYDVRLVRVRTWIEDENVMQTDAMWTALRSEKTSSPWVYSAGDGVPEAVLMALKIRSTGQLNGSIDPISIRATAVLPVWNGAAWVEQATNSPAWAYVDVLRGPQVREPLSTDFVDLDSISAWAAWNASTDIEYNWYHTDSEPVISRLRAIASCGRASWTLRNGKFGVIMDTEFDPVQMITPRNAKTFEFERKYPQVPQALRVNYIDPDTWQQAERIVYDDGFDASNSTRYEVLETQGVTSADQAHTEGRYYLAALRLRPEIYRVEMDFENLVLTRGDCALIAYDTLLVGLKWGRVNAVALDGGGLATSVELDESCTVQAGIGYVLRFRRAYDAGYVVVGVTADPGETRAFALTAPTAHIAVGDMAVFGEAGKETLLAKVSEIEYQADLSAVVTLVPAAPEIIDADTGPIPLFDPMITVPDYMIRPAAPVITGVYSGGETIHARADGTWAASVNITWQLPPSTVRVVSVEILYYGDGLDVQTVRMAPSAAFAAISDLPTGISATFNVRAESMYGRWSAMSVPATLTVAGAAGLNAPPPASANGEGIVHVRLDGTVDNLIRVYWTPPAAGTINRYEAEWRTGIAAFRGVSVSRDSLEYLIAGLDSALQYDLRVRAVNAHGIASDWVAAPAAVAPGAKATPPAAPSGLAAVSALKAVIWTWTNPSDTDLAGVELWVSATNDRSLASRVSPVRGTRFDYLVEQESTWYGWVRAVDTSGNQSAWYPFSPTAGVEGYAQPESATVPRYVDGSLLYDPTEENEGDHETPAICSIKLLATTGTRAPVALYVMASIINYASKWRKYKIYVYRDGVLLPNYKRMQSGLHPGGTGQIACQVVDLPDWQEHTYSFSVYVSGGAKSFVDMSVTLHELT